jgi:PAS domain S-box-containing protein
MRPEQGQRSWFWTTLVLSCLTVLTAVFAIWELVEQQYFQNLNYEQLHYLYITRGVASSLMLAVWAVWWVLRERRKTEEELRRSRERYWAMLAHAADAVVLLDHELRVLEWNPQATTLYGYSREEALGSLLPTVGPEERQELMGVLERLQTGDPVVELETRRRNRAAELVDVGLRVSSFQDTGSGQRVFLEMASDLQEKIRMRRKAIEMEKLTTMGRMAAGTAHTLNTPLAAMLLRVGMLEERHCSHDCGEDLKHLELSTRFCQEFVQKLLQYSRPQQTERTRIDVGEMLNSLQTFFGPTFQVRRHTLSFSDQGLRNIYVLADRGQMEALFAALLMNSLDALPTSGGGRVMLHGVVRDGRVELAVSDNGSGVPPAHLASIFEPFFTTKAAGHGTGLGLSIARNIVQEHSGTIALTNQQAGGVEVRISLPRCAAPAGCTPHAADDPVSPRSQ